MEARAVSPLKGVRLLALASLLATGIAASARDPAPSSGEEHLRRWLVRFSAADFDGDGTLTSSEAWRYQGEGPQRARAAQAKQE